METVSCWKHLWSHSPHRTASINFFFFFCTSHVYRLLLPITQASFQPLQPLIKPNLSVCWLCCHSKVSYSITPPPNPLSIHIYLSTAPIPAGCGSDVSSGKQRTMCERVCACLRVLKGLQHYGWLHLGGLLREHVPGLWNFHMCCPPWREAKKIEREASEGIRGKEMSPKCVMRACIQFESQIR